MHITRKRNKDRKKGNKKMADAGVPFDQFLQADIEAAVSLGEEIREPAEEAPATLPPKATATEAQAQAWYYDELRRRIFLMQRLDAVAYSITQLSRGVNSQMTAGNGYHDLAINKELLSTNMDTAIQTIKQHLGSALREVKELLDANTGAAEKTK